MAKKKAEEGIVISGFGILTISVRLELHVDEDMFNVPTVLQHKVQTVIPDPGVGKSHNPDRLMSAGEVFGADMGRVAHHFREALADHEDMAKGFARELQDWAKDHGRKTSG
jgi:hypothetical protein